MNIERIPHSGAIEISELVTYAGTTPVGSPSEFFHREVFYDYSVEEARVIFPHSLRAQGLKVVE